jgi:hypothetical protein
MLVLGLQACNVGVSSADLLIDKQELIVSSSQSFYQQSMLAAPFLPSNQDTKNITCALPEANANTHLDSQSVKYQTHGWEKRIAHNWSFFSAPAQQGRILIIDIKQKGDKLAYRYLANDNTQNEIYEPWSSSKIFAFTGAMAQLRIQNTSNQAIASVAQGKIGEHHIADMLTSINSYDPFGKADGNSNALATFFANLATRDYLTSLFYDEWLKLDTSDVYFRGAYGPTAFVPSEFVWHGPSANDSSPLTSMTLNMNNVATQDPGYLPYKCDDCGLTGNKPMTTLAQAEWLKRLAVHSADPVTAHPHLTQDDVNTLFYGTGHSQNPQKFAGMTLGISTMLHQSLAKHMLNGDKNTQILPKQAKVELDKVSKGQWRIFQKIGWGPSETRSTSENVVLAYVCLPHYKQGRAFIVAAQTSVADAKEENVALAGLKMQALLDSAIDEYLRID